MKKLTTEQRFFSYVAGGLVDDCWLWTGYINRGGYGRFNIWPDGQVMAHRWAYEFFIGAVPAGLDLDHLCRNRACCNPWHLEPVSRKVNLNRGIHPNAIKTHCPAGHDYAEYAVIYDGRRNCVLCRREQGRQRARLRRARQRQEVAA